MSTGAQRKIQVCPLAGQMVGAGKIEFHGLIDSQGCGPETGGGAGKEGVGGRRIGGGPSRRENVVSEGGRQGRRRNKG